MKGRLPQEIGFPGFHQFLHAVPVKLAQFIQFFRGDYFDLGDLFPFVVHFIIGNEWAISNGFPERAFRHGVDQVGIPADFCGVK
jgi:hypothetical protein